VSRAIRFFVVLAAVAALGARFSAAPQAATSAPCGVEMRVLVVAADGKEAALPAITRTLDYLGTPYTTHIATQRPNTITPGFLADGCHGNFQAVILTNAEVGYSRDGTWTPALSADEVAALHAYEAQFRVRQVIWYAFPTPELGFTWGVAASAPVDIAPTDAGRRVFPYLTLAQPLPIRNAFTYLARVSDASTTALFTDAQGNALVAIKRYPDGRENLALTFDSNPDLVHSVVLGYGIVNWVTRGIFIGERGTYLSAQVDDIFLDTRQWRASTPCGTDPETVTGQVRMTGNDMRAVVAWQRTRNAQPLTQRLRLTMAFNGEGAGGAADPLTTEALAAQQSFHWVNHTWTHATLDATSYTQSLDEIRLNVAFAQRSGLTSFGAMNIVTPQITGLTNPDFLRAAVDAGVRYLVSDASRPGYDSPRPNTALNNALAPALVMIPRRANNLFYNVTAPADWAAEYNCLYRSYWGRALTFDEVVDFESQQLLMHLLRGELNPWMFHQANLVAYDGTRTLLTDLLDVTLAKYSRYVNWPIESPTMDAVGAAMEARMRRYDARVTATLQPGRGVVITSDRSVRVPITGLGQSTTWVDVAANGPTVVSLSGGSAPGDGGVPAGWSTDDVGSSGAPDAMRFSYVPLGGDGTIVARLTALTAATAQPTAGVMIRDSLYAGAAYAGMVVSTGAPHAFHHRVRTDGATARSDGWITAPPVFLRLDRTGDIISAFESVDGISWVFVGRQTIPMGRQVFAGVGSSPGAAATFEAVSVTPSDCLISLPSDRSFFTSTAGASAIDVAAGSACSWTATTDASWLTVTAGATGTGAGVVNYAVAANTTGAPRTATLTIGNRRLTIRQAPGLPAAGDLNRDGQLDLLVWQRTTGTIGAWIMNGTDLVDGKLLTPGVVADLNWMPVGMGDFDRDGHNDVLWQHTNRSLAVWLMNGTERRDVQYLQPAQLPVGWTARAVTDTNGDGFPDIVMQHEAGWLGVRVMNGLALADSHLITPQRVPDVRWRIAGAGDFNRDGRNDLVWQHDDGWLAVWYMDGDVRLDVSYLSPSRLADTAWKVKGTGDVNRDGKVDLLLQHAVTGDMAVWLMNGATLLDGRLFRPSRPAADAWMLVGPR
jgi:hypothetical protein